MASVSPSMSLRVGATRTVAGGAGISGSDGGTGVGLGGATATSAKKSATSFPFTNSSTTSIGFPSLSSATIVQSSPMSNLSGLSASLLSSTLTSSLSSLSTLSSSSSSTQPKKDGASNANALGQGQGQGSGNARVERKTEMFGHGFGGGGGGTKEYGGRPPVVFKIPKKKSHDGKTRGTVENVEQLRTPLEDNSIRSHLENEWRINELKTQMADLKRQKRIWDESAIFDFAQRNQKLLVYGEHHIKVKTVREQPQFTLEKLSPGLARHLQDKGIFSNAHDALVFAVGALQYAAKTQERKHVTSIDIVVPTKRVQTERKTKRDAEFVANLIEKKQRTTLSTSSASLQSPSIHQSSFPTNQGGGISSSSSSSSSSSGSSSGSSSSSSNNKKGGGGGRGSTVAKDAEGENHGMLSKDEGVIDD